MEADGTTSLVVSNNSAAAQIPGLTLSITVPANGLVYLSTDGGVATQAAEPAGFSLVDIEMFVDGSLLPTTSRGIFALNNGGAQGVFANWSVAKMAALSAGTHTIQVMALGGGAGANATVSGDATSLLQGKLIALILNQ